MERKIDLYFQKWKKDVIRKPLILYGAKQIGKTYSALSFGKKEYKNTVYINSQNNKELKEIFQKERSTEKLILRLSTLTGETILKEDTLIVIDNVNDLDIIKGSSRPLNDEQTETDKTAEIEDNPKIRSNTSEPMMNNYINNN